MMTNTNYQVACYGVVRHVDLFGVETHQSTVKEWARSFSSRQDAETFATAAAGENPAAAIYTVAAVGGGQVVAEFRSAKAVSR